MPNVLDRTGLQVKTRREILTELESGFQSIYGQDIALGQDTPDGQLINILAQILADFGELIKGVYSSQDPDQAIGNSLSRLGSINGIQRKAGSYTVTKAIVTTDRPLTLYGQDQTDRDVFTIQDNEGNRFQLISTTSIGTPGEIDALFRSEVVGAVLVIPNTLKTQATIVVGVTSVNNPNKPTTIGTNEETDTAFRLRRELAVSKVSDGYLNSVQSGLLNLEGIVSVIVDENSSNVVGPYGTAPHTIWPILSGSATPEAIANVLYAKRSAGCGMRGEVSHTLNFSDGSSFEARWSNFKFDNSFLRLTAMPLIPSNVALNFEDVKQGIFANFKLVDVGPTTNNDLITQVHGKLPNVVLSDVEFSDGRVTTITVPSFDNLVANTGSVNPFKEAYIDVTYNDQESEHIEVFNTDAEILGKIQALDGLNNVTISITRDTTSGNTANFKMLQITIPRTDDVTSLVSVRDARLGERKISGLGAVQTLYEATVTHNFSPIITPTNIDARFVLAKDRIFFLPLTLTAQNNVNAISLIAPIKSVQFYASQGYGEKFFFIVDPSTNLPPTITPSNDMSIVTKFGTITKDGIFTAAGNVSVDGLIIRVQDDLGNKADYTVDLVATGVAP